MPVSIFKCTGHRTRESQLARRAGKRIQLFNARNRRGQRVVQRVFFLAAPHSHHDQHASGDSTFPEGHTFIGRGDAEPASAFLLQRSCTLRIAMSVGIALHHRADCHLGPDMLLQYSEIVAQCRKRYLSPVRTGVGSGEYRLAEQDTFMISREQRARVLTTQLLAHSSRWLQLASARVRIAQAGREAFRLSKLPACNGASITVESER